MITTDELATVRAALRYWQEEMCPHGAETMRPYFDQLDVKPLSIGEIDRLREFFSQDAVRYGFYDPVENRLADSRLFSSADVAIRSADAASQVVTVLLPSTETA